MENTQDNLAQRVDDIEKTIGDFAQVVQALKDVLIGDGNGGPSPIDPPTCPPYCAHRVKKDYEDPLPLADRIADMRQCIGDFGVVLQSLKDALVKMVPPDCPPYCAHDADSGKKQY